MEKSLSIITESEELADKILVNKQELFALDKRRQETREALRLMEKSEEPKVWITVGSMLIKMEREKATQLLKKGEYIRPKCTYVNTLYCLQISSK